MNTKLVSFALLASSIALISCSGADSNASKRVPHPQSESTDNDQDATGRRSGIPVEVTILKRDGSANENVSKAMSFVELSRFIDAQETPEQLAKLAQKEFYFEVVKDHLAEAEAYVQLQEKIAKKIPNEFERPVFDIKFLFSDKKHVSEDHVIGILGGTGPLSDAHITKIILKRLDTTQVATDSMIHLFSLPPPRNSKEQVAGGITYAARLTTFLRHGYGEYFLASNTAHLNLPKLSALAGSDHIENLPKIIAERIAKDQVTRSQNDRILILGTKQAWDGKLYDTIFNDKKMLNVVVDPDEAIEVQAWIDRIKQDMFSESDRIELKAYIAKLGTKYKANALLLSCTELPLGLGPLMEELQTEGFEIYDTEEMIADIIAETFQNLSN